MADEKIVRRSPRTAISSKASSSTARTIENGGSDKANAAESVVQETPKAKILRKSPRMAKSPEDHALKSVDLVDDRPSKKAKISPPSKGKKNSNPKCFFVGDPIPVEEARQRWPLRYEKSVEGNKGSKKIDEDDDEDAMVLDVKCHYAQAEIEGCIYDIGDCAYVKGEKGGVNFVGRILEFFESMESLQYFTVQWFFRASDTVLKMQSSFHDKKRLFYSDLRNDNLLDCIVSKVKTVQVEPSVNLELKAKSIPPCDFYFDMKYSVEYSTFCTMANDMSGECSDLSSSSCTGTVHMGGVKTKPYMKEFPINREPDKSEELSLLDLYSGCGGMSTGLSLGAKLSGVNLVTRWAVDFNKSACESLKLNHPETQVRNESAEDFFDLLKEWDKLCKQYAVGDVEKTQKSNSRVSKVNETKVDSYDDSKIPSGEYEVLRLLDICYGDPSESGERELKFKVRWKGYGPSEDTWESMEGLSKCQDLIRDFVREGFKSKILPLPGDVGVVCGGPPCQGVSGFNRHRNANAPLDDERNHQIVVFMDIVTFLRPKYVLMENVVDILKFDGGSVGRYAISRLVHINYQARLGIMAAGCYGLPQFRLRVFLWGSHPYEKLPQYPLPTHDVVVRGCIPREFERNTVAYDEDQPRELEKELLLQDAISDLPVVSSQELRDAIPYGKAPQTDFQRYIRSTKNDMVGSTSPGVKGLKKPLLYDHLPLHLNEDDYLRVCRIPRKKGACFRDLPGVVVGNDNVVKFDPAIGRELLPSGKPLVPDYAMNFNSGKSTKPFARLWWDETVPTVVTRAEPHNQVIIHPEQDRVLTVRENARLQGFPDYYKLCGTVKERYCQMGNAVAVPVARALGYSLGMAWLKLSGDQPLMSLPPKFSYSLNIQRLPSSSSEVDL